MSLQLPQSKDPWSGWKTGLLILVVTSIITDFGLKISIFGLKISLFVVLTLLFFIIFLLKNISINIFSEVKSFVIKKNIKEKKYTGVIDKSFGKRVFIFCGKGTFGEKFKYFEKNYTQNIYCYINMNLSTINANNIKELCFYITKNIISSISEEEKYDKNDLIEEFEMKWNGWKNIESWQDNLSLLIVDFLNRFREHHSVRKKNENNYIICIRNFDSITSVENKIYLINKIINPFSKRGIIFFIDSKEDSDSDFFYPGDENVHIEKYCQ